MTNGAIMADATLCREIREEHRVWRFNTLVLYDLVMSHTLEWPSLTVQWIPGINPKEGITGETLLIGTHTADDEPNYLLLIEVGLPNEHILPEGMRYDQCQDYCGFSFGEDSTRKFNVNARIPHEGEVNKALYNPCDPTKIATKAISGDVNLFDSTKFGPLVLKSNFRGQMHADLTLKGHTAEGWGMCWNTVKEGFLASVADDGRFCLWDINAYSTRKEMQPYRRFSCNSSPMQDVTWVDGDSGGHVCISVNDEGNMLLWDIREDCAKAPTKKICVSNLPIVSISSNSLRSDIIAVGGADQNINIWDMRQVSKPLHRIIASHQEAVVRLQWANWKPSLLASASSDRFVTLWDLDRVGMEQSADDIEDGPPELIFTHGGHTAPVSDICWNPESEYRWMMVSVAEDNVLQIWQPSKKAFQQQRFETDIESSDDEFEVE
ncbi:RbAp48 [Cardiosporidium cionae]|uniref:RbAp48 n=1 Tax=Cardiosporidium cionae TaxID=476202 RepID=A0ABQ7J7I5_9APIC|nr:RbAp48 [Cardiosporidium cionae]|eukprot:KAF8819954.1 RbAp48 [Cardiosporidium cionae]